ncbi:MAG TPA: peptidylprolyl isomerase, partial [Candidatus Wallbacteria bacterium]|nr:peptidylprolyl isomerase [Candidatus Wallbacteria bacterium]
TDNVLILKNIDNIALYTGETSLTLCTIKDDKVTVAEVKNKLSQYLNGSVSYKLFSDEEFLKFIIYEIIFEPAYVKHLIKRNVQFSFKPFGEYYVYAVAETFLNHFLKNVSITSQECERYYKDNQDKLTIKESVLLNYYIFSDGQKSFFEKAVNGSLDPLKLSAAVKEGSIECSVNENERFYKGQLANELQNYLLSLKPGSYSRIIELNTSGVIKYILFYVKSLDSEKPSTYSEIEKFVYRQALADKKAREAVKLFDELFKKYKVKINLK